MSIIDLVLYWKIRNKNLAFENLQIPIFLPTCSGDRIRYTRKMIHRATNTITITIRPAARTSKGIANFNVISRYPEWNFINTYQHCNILFTNLLFFVVLLLFYCQMSFFPLPTPYRTVLWLQGVSLYLLHIKYVN